MRTFSADLLKWWRINGRSFPWRTETDPYRILVAEILLHRTNAERVTSVYLQFISKFPDIKSIHESNFKEVFEVAKSLGLGWRLKLIKDMASIVQYKYEGKIPFKKEELLSLPGVGDYISSALRVFGRELEDPLVDTNTVRVICRIHKEKMKESTRRGKWIRRIYSQLKGDAKPSDFGYGLIDLASLICLPKVPLCKHCPVIKYCETGKLESTTSVCQ
jgi:A/G-specific adenine glycosylase